MLLPSVTDTDSLGLTRVCNNSADAPPDVPPTLPLRPVATEAHFPLRPNSRLGPSSHYAIFPLPLREVPAYLDKCEACLVERLDHLRVDEPTPARELWPLVQVGFLRVKPVLAEYAERACTKRVGRKRFGTARANVRLGPRSAQAAAQVSRTGPSRRDKLGHEHGVGRRLRGPGAGMLRSCLLMPQSLYRGRSS